MTSERNPRPGAEDQRHTLTYRAAESAQVMNWVKAGQSGCVLALRGGGKSNFLRFLLRDDVRQRYLESDTADFVFILIDLLALTECTEWALCELIFDRLLAQYEVLEMEVRIVEEMVALHRDVMRSKDTLAAYRALEHCLGVLCRRPARRVVLFFNEFDTAFRTLNPRLFHSLRAMRDAYKDQVSYVIAVTNDLASLRDNPDEVEPFYYLVSSNICYLGPLNDADTRYRLHYLAAQRSVELSEQDVVRVLELSGGYPSLFRAILNLLWDPNQKNGLADIAPTLKDEPAVQAECRKIWNSLTEKERDAICTLASGVQIDPPTLERLKRRGLIRTGPARLPMIFAALFADFARRQTAASSTSRVVIQRDTREVEIDGRRVTHLTELEFEAFCYLYEHRGQVCTKDDLIANVYRLQHERMKGGVSDETLQTLISRLRDKIEPERGPRYVLTVRGEGYRFVEPGQP